MKIIPISGIIGFDVIPSDIRSKLNEANGADVEFQISTEGGSVFEGLEIFNLIKNYEGKTTSRLVGLAASMGSYIAIAADNVIAETNAVFYIHNARVFAGGDHHDLRRVATVIESLSKLLAEAYVAKTGKSLAAMAKLMTPETYYFGVQILEAGFADEMAQAPDAETAQAKEELLKNAAAKIVACNEKMKANIEKFADLDKIAALLPKCSGNAKIINHFTKEDIMDLKEFLAKHPDAKKQYDAELAFAKEEGKTLGLEEGKSEAEKLDMSAVFELSPIAKKEHEKIVSDARAEVESGKLSKENVKAVGEVISSSAYGASIKNAGVKVLTGEKDFSGFEDLVAHADETNARFKAMKTVGSQPEVTPGADPTSKLDGEAKTKASAEALSSGINDVTGKVQ